MAINLKKSVNRAIISLNFVLQNGGKWITMKAKKLGGIISS